MEYIIIVNSHSDNHPITNQYYNNDIIYIPHGKQVIKIDEDNTMSIWPSNRWYAREPSHY